MNLDIYTTEMSKSIWDKAFFMDKIPDAKCVIDFGCADGAMVRFLAPLFPDIMFVGFDINEELISRARAATPFYANNVFFGNYEDVITFVKDKYTSDEICINFASVLHEVFSSTPEGKTSIYDMVRILKPKYITIRDMYFIEEENRNLSFSYVERVLTDMNIDRKYIQVFEEMHESIMTIKGLLHFLMKYQWKDNGWKNELEENYFAWQLHDFLDLTRYEYTRTFEAHYMLPYYDEKWKDLHLMPNTVHTHAQFVLRRCR